MTGKRRWFNYVTDDGALFAVDMDFSNATIARNTPAAINTRTLPRGITPRFVTYSQNPGILVRRIIVGTNTSVGLLPPNFSETVDGVVVTFRRGVITSERERKSTSRP